MHMKITKYIFVIGSAVLLSATWTGCNKFLDINPKSEVINDDMFSSAEGCEDALYGIYATIGSQSDLFGLDLSIAIPEILTGNIGSDRTNEYGEFAQRVWNLSYGPAARASLWRLCYEVIGYINNAILNLERSEEHFRYMDIYKGEAYALRAFMHFEVAKYFAVAFHSTDQERLNKALPYVTTYEYVVTPYSTLSDYFAKIIDDLKTAESYLADDERYVTAQRTNAATDFVSCRMIHLNLYAVKALLARVYWYMNDLENAEIYASQVIDSQKFPLMSSSEFINAENGTINLKETIFGLYSTQCPELYYRNFFQNNSFTLASGVIESYETDGLGVDVRVSRWFNTADRTCTKHLNPATASGQTYTGQSIIGIPLISISEMYMIVAEAKRTSDPAASIAAMDKVIEARGLTKYADRPDVSELSINDIVNERKKEFIMESLIFTDYKRLGRDVTIASSTFDGMDDDTYTMPIPATAEDNYRE